MANLSPRQDKPRSRRTLVLEGWQDHPLFLEMTAQTRAVAIALHGLRNTRTKWDGRRGGGTGDVLDQQAAKDFVASFNEITRASGVSRRKVTRTVGLLIRLGLLERTFRGNSVLRSDGHQQYTQANRYRLPRWSEELLDAALEVWRSMPSEERYTCGFREEGSVTVTPPVVSQSNRSPRLPSVIQIPPESKEKNRKQSTTPDLQPQAALAAPFWGARSLASPAPGGGAGDDKPPPAGGPVLPPSRIALAQSEGAADDPYDVASGPCVDCGQSLSARTQRLILEWRRGYPDSLVGAQPQRWSHQESPEFGFECPSEAASPPSGQDGATDDHLQQRAPVAPALGAQALRREALMRDTQERARRALERESTSPTPKK